MQQDKTLFFAAQGQLDDLIQQHLFVISPNNSGSTFLKQALAASSHTWNLPHEGQASFGFHGPVTRGKAHALVWAARPDWLRHYEDAANYDWNRTRAAWYLQAYSRSNIASVFVEKSPSFLCQVAGIRQAFVRAGFIFLIRNPYAAIEGILRRRPAEFAPGEYARLAARHLLTCMKIQRANIERFSESGVFFSYEEMCDSPEETILKIQAMVPCLSDLRLNQPLRVKGHAEARLENMNQSQIQRLTVKQLDLINSEFSLDHDVMTYFGYELMDEV